MKKSLEKLALIYFGEKDGRRFFEYINRESNKRKLQASGKLIQ